MSDDFVVLVDGKDKTITKKLNRFKHKYFETISDNKDLKRVFDHYEGLSIPVFVVCGNDRFMARVWWVYNQRTESFSAPPKWMLIQPEGQKSLIQRSLRTNENVQKQIKSLKKHLKKRKPLPVKLLPTLRLTRSDKPQSQYAFNIGFGLISEIFNALDTSLLSKNFKPTDLVAKIQKLYQGQQNNSQIKNFRFTINYKPQSADTNYILTSTLEKTWFNLAMSDQSGAHFYSGDSKRAFIQRIVESQTLLKRLNIFKEEIKPFDIMHLDGIDNCVVDGFSEKMKTPGIIEISAGKPVPLIIL